MSLWTCCRCLMRCGFDGVRVARRARRPETAQPRAGLLLKATVRTTRPCLITKLRLVWSARCVHECCAAIQWHVQAHARHAERRVAAQTVQRLQRGCRKRMRVTHRAGHEPGCGGHGAHGSHRAPRRCPSSWPCWTPASVARRRRGALIRRPCNAHYGLTDRVLSATRSRSGRWTSCAAHGERRDVPAVWTCGKACCGLRKVEPLARLLEGRSAWVTGLRREPKRARAPSWPPSRTMTSQGRSQVQPARSGGRKADVWHHIGQRTAFRTTHCTTSSIPSIGCAPCTRAVTPGEDFRAGRWWWEQAESAKECGLARECSTHRHKVNV